MNLPELQVMCIWGSLIINKTKIIVNIKLDTSKTQKELTLGRLLKYALFF